MNILLSNGPLRQASPLKPSPGPAPSKPAVPADKVELASQDSSPSFVPKWASLTVASLGLLGAAAGMAQAQQAQVVIAPEPAQPPNLSAQLAQRQKADDCLKKLDEYSLKQGIEIDYKAPSPVGGGRRIDREGAARLFAEGRRVLLAEVTRADGPVRSDQPASQVRREVYLTGNQDLESYTRYFTNARPQNDTERAAQQLKKYVYGQTELTTLLRPGQNPERPTLSPFAAARRLDQKQEVNVRREPDGLIRTEVQEWTLGQVSDLGSVLGLQPSEHVGDIMQRLDESSLRQGILLEYRAPSPLGGGRTISPEDAAQMISEGGRVGVAEVTSSTGPFRGLGGEVRRETALSGRADLESYARYFTGAQPQNDTERAAQQLKHQVYDSLEQNTLVSPDQLVDQATLSPFEAARRLASGQPVTLRVQPDGEIRTEVQEWTLGSLSDLNSMLGMQKVGPLMDRLDVSSLKQGILLEYRASSPLGGGRTISQADAARLISEGGQVGVAEVTSATGPFRGLGGEVRREASVKGLAELESYTRYFTGARAQNDTERAAQQLKDVVYGSLSQTTLLNPDQESDQATLSPFEAARRLAGAQPVTLHLEPDGMVRREVLEIPLHDLNEVLGLTAPPIQEGN